MGNCFRKPIIVYQSILEECYDLLNQQTNSQQNIKNKKKTQQQETKSSTHGKSNSIENVLMQECTEAIKEKANKSFDEFNQQDVNKLQSQVRLSANTLSDHIQDTHVRLIDSVNYIKRKLKSDKTSYPIQWITLQILQVLVVNLKNYTQKHISLKQAQPEDSNVASKIDNQTEQNDTDNKQQQHPGNNFQNSVACSKVDQQQQQQQITFFSDNFIRFEMDFLEIALYILSEKCNPFYAASRNAFLGILLKFSMIHKDHYTSEKIYRLTDQLEIDIQHLAKEILTNDSQTTKSNSEKIQTLKQLMEAYTATFSKIRTQQSVFRSKNQLYFFNFLLQSIIDFNKLFSVEENKQPLLKVQQLLSASPDTSNLPIHDPAASPLKEKISQQEQQNKNQIPQECIRMIRVFSRRSFILKNYNVLLSNLFLFFDSSKWDESLMIESVINETISVACEESVQLNYKVYLLEQLIEYLLMIPSSAGNNNNNNSIPTIIMHPNTLNAQIVDSIQQNKNINLEKRINTETNVEQKFINFADKKVKISVLKLFNTLVQQKDREIPMLMHSTTKIVKCFLENLKEFTSVPEVRSELQSSFVHYALQFAPDSSSLLSLLTALSSDIADQFGSSNLAKTPYGQINTPRNNNTPNITHAASGFKLAQTGQQNQPQQQQSQQNQSQQTFRSNQNYNSNEETLKYILEGLILMQNTIDCASSNFVASPIITDELIINLLFLSNLEKAALISFQVITKLLLLKLRSAYPQQAGTPAIGGAFDFTTNQISYLSFNPNFDNNSSSTFLQISQNSLLHIFYQCLKSIMFLHVQEDNQTLCNAVIIVQYTNQIIQEIIKRNNLLQIRSVVAYLAKLIKETILFQNSPSQQKASGQHTPKKELYTSVQLNSHAQQKNPVCYNILQLAVIQLLQIMEPVLGLPGDQAKIKIDSSELSALMKSYLQIFALHNKQTQQNKKTNDSPKYKQKNAQAAGDNESEIEIVSQQQGQQAASLSDINDKFILLSDEILSTPYLPNKVFQDHCLLDLILKSAKTQGFSSDQNCDFDELTAQFARNFTSAVGDIDFQNFNPDDESSFVSNQLPPRNNNNHNKNSSFNPFTMYNSVQSIGQIEMEDEQFGNILGMIQRRDLEVPNLFKEDTAASRSKEVKDIEMAQLQQKNQKQLMIDMNDVNISVF